jgi:NADP-dependent 3-hydroxy acid dehydrogenase YdfG
VYDATKFGLRAMTDAVADEQRQNNIKVIGLYPGATDTAIWGGLELEQAPGHEGMMRPADIAQAILYVLQQPASVHISDISLAPLKPVL